MVRTASASPALLIAASALFTLCNADLQYKVRVRNLTYQQPFSPIGMFGHTDDIVGFRVGETAYPELRTLAENGDLSELLRKADDEDIVPFVFGFTYGQDPLPPGGEEWFTLVVNEEICPHGAYFSLVSMLVNTNDAFVGLDAALLDTNGASMYYLPAYDAGTEDNNELCSHIPGPACSETSGNQQAGPGEGVIHIHRGFHGVGGGLEADDYDWRNPVAEVFIAKPTWV